MKAAYSFFFTFCVFFQATLAGVFDQLQFMKIISPTNGQSIEIGTNVTIQYAMQPTVYQSTSNGYAKNIVINFHKRTGDQKQEQIENICPTCPLAAKQDQYVTYTKQWTVPTNVTPGSYAFDFVETVQLRRGEITSSETVKVNIVD
ncbi:hypothetical protein G6F16_001546 [Rhizopus arrhizus]|uniref:Phosphatidylglycerol/phosphatidylinositol transfer protein n=1 Tax=Rhizopus oryzae TaxID=64495 RepID=A0A9P6XFQ5_RHIOR|nr:hypothetical protein G6F24_006525 [Rhizopus arrhizus]KAG0794478.1 hypothetical protein G6F21_002839 [Rhizopus arrhizus]KAG0815828.1 hypothetical protein G6F20_003687 [Rhizopus arrhizus]KAG0837094.1 hypothetical protein G6F19_003886 [Rhizopus arrhizus]KAG0840120.1 hypothetical protein G6F18_003811 [Rhizopus arrhizus]